MALAARHPFPRKRQRRTQEGWQEVVALAVGQLTQAQIALLEALLALEQMKTSD